MTLIGSDHSLYQCSHSIYCIDLKELCIRDSDFPGRSSNHRRSEFCPEIIQSGLTADETCNRYSLYH